MRRRQGEARRLAHAWARPNAGVQKQRQPELGRHVGQPIGPNPPEMAPPCTSCGRTASSGDVRVQSSSAARR
eukprot:12795545-Prorocentrum_lima.AAC.1